MGWGKVGVQMYQRQIKSGFQFFDLFKLIALKNYWLLRVQECISLSVQFSLHLALVVRFLTKRFLGEYCPTLGKSVCLGLGVLRSN